MKERNLLLLPAVPAGRGIAVSGGTAAVLLRTPAVLTGVPFVGEGVGAITGGSVKVSAGQVSVRKAGVSIVVAGAAASVPLDRRRIPGGCPLSPSQRQLLTGIGGCVARTGQRIALLCQLRQQRVIDGIGRGLALTSGQVGLPRREVTLCRVPVHDCVTSGPAFARSAGHVAIP